MDTDQPPPLVDIQHAYAAQDEAVIPNDDQFKHWVALTLPASHSDWDLTIRLVDRDESQQLNREYRGKDKPTNVLSFPSDIPPELEVKLLGDIIICVGVVCDEAQQQNKPILNHWAHLTVHGVLHLLGYDHIEEADAEAMEQREIDILAELNMSNPYIAPYTGNIEPGETIEPEKTQPQD